jgi:hypothetical protein
MKKLILAIILVVTLSQFSQAQDYKTSLGLRGGLPVGLTVKHFLSDKYALEGILGSRWGGFEVAGLYEVEQWTGQYPALNWYWGAGAHLGTWSQGYNPRIAAAYNGAVIGIDGVIGIEYTFDELPLNLSLDLMPAINIIGFTGWGGINGALSIRYVF